MPYKNEDERCACGCYQDYIYQNNLENYEKWSKPKTFKYNVNVKIHSDVGDFSMNYIVVSSDIAHAYHQSNEKFIHLESILNKAIEVIDISFKIEQVKDG